MKLEHRTVEISGAEAFGMQLGQTVKLAEDQSTWLIHGMTLTDGPCTIELVRGGVYGPAPTWDEAERMPCPNCEAKMTPTKAYGHFTGENIAFSTSNPHWTCPKCQKNMMPTHDYPIPAEPWKGWKPEDDE